MKKANQPDLFGTPQGDLFGPPPAQPAYKPNPVHVRNRLNSLLEQARAAETMPWNDVMASLYKMVFPRTAKLLSEDEANEYILQFEKEWARLTAA